MRLTSFHLDVLTQLINVGLARAALGLNRVSRSPLHLVTPRIAAVTAQQENRKSSSMTGDEAVSIKLRFHGCIEGEVSLVFRTDLAARLVSVIIGKEEQPFAKDPLRIGAMEEVGSGVLNGAMESIQTALRERIEYYPPSICEGMSGTLMPVSPERGFDVLLWASVECKQIHLLGEGNLIFLFREVSFHRLLTAIDEMT